jgi:hypothetical protein
MLIGLDLFTHEANERTENMRACAWASIIDDYCMHSQCQHLRHSPVRAAGASAGYQVRFGMHAWRRTAGSREGPPWLPAASSYLLFFGWWSMLLRKQIKRSRHYRRNHRWIGALQATGGKPETNRHKCSPHYRNPWLCRLLGCLSSAFCRTLGKEAFIECRTRQSPALGNNHVCREQDSRYRYTLGKGPSAAVYS